jgi:hypothetical protein
MGTRVRLRDVRTFRFRINPVESEVGRDMFGYLLMRPISLYLTWLFLRAGVTANTVTVLQMLVGLAGAGCLAWGDIGLKVLGIGMVYFGFLLDNCDGEVARFRGEVSITGQFLDTLSHHVVNSSLFAAIGVAAWRATTRVEALALGFLASLAGQRMDISLSLAQALRAARTPLDQQFAYFQRDIPPGTAGLVEDLQGISKKGTSLARRMAFGVFSYPGVMHVLLVLVGLELLLRRFVPGTHGGAWLAAAWLYGILLPLRRAVTLRTVVQTRLADRLFREAAKGVAP